MKHLSTYNIVNFIIAGVWIANGLFCKVLDLVPRHEEIVARILGAEHSTLFVRTIGVLEVLMAIWIITGIWYSFNAWMQIIVVATMNIIEFILAQDLLLWGKLNAFFAFLFILLVYYNAFILKLKSVQQT